MSQGLCPSCGAAVKLTAGQTDTKCAYCDSVVTLQQAEAQASELKQSKFAGTLLIAETAQEGGSYAEAINYFNKVIEQEPTFADAWLNKGICLVYTSKIGDLKIPEAISSWKAAIQFAKNPEAMAKRVAKEINNAVSDFYPMLEQHFLKFRNVGDSLLEHCDRFRLLESALAYALEISPNLTIAKNGIFLCDRFDASMSGSNINRAASKVFDVSLKGAVALLLPRGPFKTKFANDSNSLNGFEETLKLTRRKYEEVVARLEPEFMKARVKHEQEAAQRAEFPVRAVKWCCIGILGFLFAGSGFNAVVMLLQWVGIVDYSGDHKDGLGTSAAFTSVIALSALGVLIKMYRELGTGSSQNRETKASESDEPK